MSTGRRIHRTVRRRRSLAGFTLIEVLVALLVLSIGMLGIAALYLESLRASRQALVRTEAVTLASDIADRIRSNRNPVSNYDCGGTCDAGEGGNAIAIADINAWITAVTAQLPGGTASITYTAPAANTPAVYDISVSWTEIGYASPLTYALRVEI
jgi:type IV pilus assembly protein PilV